jgi:xyloglucan-specific exo-beta-1,4-glucanase
MKKNRMLVLLSFFLIGNINAQVNWKNVSTKGMGYVSGLYIQPTTNIKYVRTDVAGLFRFDNSNQKWTNLLDNLILLDQVEIRKVESFAFDKNPAGLAQTIYALCGGGTKSYLLKSINDGVSWTINQGWDGSIIADGNAEWRCSGEKLAIDPVNSNVVYCGTRKNGLYKTTNAGTLWSKINSFTAVGGTGGFGAGDEGGVSFVVFDPSSTISVGGQTVSKNIYVGVIDGGVYRSNNGGVTWSLLSGGFDANTLNPVRALFNNNRLIVTLLKDAVSDGNAGFNEQNDGAVWQFTPNAANATGVWANKTPGQLNPLVCPFYSTYKFNAVAVKPGAPNTVYVACRSITPKKIFYTTNFNAAVPTWKILTTETAGYNDCSSVYQLSTYTTPPTWTKNSSDDWVGDIAFDPLLGNKLWITTGNGVITIDDVNANPAVISGAGTMNGLEMLCVNAMVSPPAPNAVPLVTASMDILGIRYTNLDNGSAVKLDNTFGLGAGTSLDYSFKNPNTLVALGQDYGIPVLGRRVIRSTDGGINWQNIYTPAATCTDAAWGGNIAISSTNTNNIVWIPKSRTFLDGCVAASINQPRYTTNGGVSWNFCNNINFPNGSFTIDNGNAYNSGKVLESDKVNGNTFYYFALTDVVSFTTSVWRSINGGANWAQVNTGTLPGTGAGQFKANPFVEGDLWFCPFNEFKRDVETDLPSRRLYHSTDGGATWATVTTLDEVYAFGFGMKPLGTNNARLTVYGKKNGVQSLYTSTDLGVTFTDIGTLNIPEGIISNIEGDMKVQGRVYASTFCRGVWYGDIPGVAAPANLCSFYGNKITNTQNRINWGYNSTTASTTFAIQRSATTSNFQTLYTTPANSSTDCLYPFLYNDYGTLVGNNYYRLKITESNSVVSYSNVILITNNTTSMKAQLLTNVIEQNAQLQVSSTKTEQANVTVYDATGRLMKSFQYNIAGGKNLFNIDFSELTAGSYYMNVVSKSGTMESIRFVKK